MARREGSGVLAILDVRGDREDRLRGDGTTIHRQALDLAHDGGHDPLGNVIGTIVVVAVKRELALGAVADHQIVVRAFDIFVLVTRHVLGVLVVDWVHLGVLACGKRIGGDRQAGHAAAQGAVDLAVVQRHLDGLIRILVMHVMNDVQRFDVGLRKPFEGLLIVGLHLLVIERAVSLGLDRLDDALVDHLHAGHLVTAAVDRVEQRLGGVHASREELHLLAHTHRGDAACNGRIVTPMVADLLVGFILDGRGINGDLGAETLVAFRQLRIPENRDVRFGSRSQMLERERVEQTERRLGDHGAAIVAEACIRPCRPVGVAREDRIVVLGAQESHDAQLHHQIVDDLLGVGLGDLAFLEIALEVDVEER